MDADVQSWNQTVIGSMEAHRLTATEEISGYSQCWEKDGSHVLGQRRRDTHYVPKSTTVTGETYEDVLRSFFQHCVKNGPKRLQLCSFITTMLLLIGRLVFTSFSRTTTLKLFLMLRTHLTSHQAIFGCFQHWRTLFVVEHFQVVPLLATAIYQWSKRTPKEAFAAAMQSWRQCCEKCVRLQGDYIEKWLHFQLPRMSNFFFF